MVSGQKHEGSQDESNSRRTMGDFRKFPGENPRWCDGKESACQCHDYLGLEDLFLYNSSVYSCHLFLISSASVRSIPFLSLCLGAGWKRISRHETE